MARAFEHARSWSEEESSASLLPASFEFDCDSTETLRELHGEKLPLPRWRQSLANQLPRAAVLCFIILTFIIGYQLGQSSPQRSIPYFQAHDSGDTQYVDVPTSLRADLLPSGTKIVGLVFYGRPMFVNILDCYLRQNLAINGGVLDEIRFILHTSDQGDIQWLEDLVERDGLNDSYKLVYEPDPGHIHEHIWTHGGDFSYLWSLATDEDTIFVKIDDDVVFIDSNAIPRMVNSLLAHPEAYSIQSNIINSRFTHWFHYTTSAIKPFLPAPGLRKTSGTTTSVIHDWRTSRLPDFPLRSLRSDGRQQLPNGVDAAHRNSHWLPLPDTADNLLRTPFGDGHELPIAQNGNKEPAPEWPIAVQEHYSFFQNYERGQLSTYYFGRPSDGLWNTLFQHYNVNFMVFWGKTMASRPFWNETDTANYLSNDEYALTIDVPKELGMPVLVDTRAIVSHYAFHGHNQRNGVLMTDVLQRYRLLANEIVCSKDNQKEPYLDSETDDPSVDPGDVDPSDVDR